MSKNVKLLKSNLEYQIPNVDYLGDIAVSRLVDEHTGRNMKYTITVYGDEYKVALYKLQSKKYASTFGYLALARETNAAPPSIPAYAKTIKGVKSQIRKAVEADILHRRLNFSD